MPTTLHTCDALALSERLIIGPSSPRSPARSLRERTSGWRRYATRSIALTTLAEGTARRTPTPRRPAPVLTPKETTPARLSAN